VGWNTEDSVRSTYVLYTKNALMSVCRFKLSCTTVYLGRNKMARQKKLQNIPKLWLLFRSNNLWRAEDGNAYSCKK
jgi:hypothetical protein